MSNTDSLLMARGGNQVVLCDIKTKSIVGKGMLEDEDLTDCDLSADGKLLATCSKTRKTAIMTIKHDRTTSGLAAISESAKTVTFSPNCKKLATGGFDGSVSLWSAATGALLKVLEKNGETPQILRFTPDGKFLVSCDLKGFCRVWDVAREIKVKTFQTSSQHSSMAFLPDLKTLILGSITSGKLTYWEFSAGKPSTRFGNTSFPGCLATCSQKTGAIALWGEDQVIHIYDSFGEREKYYGEGHQAAVTCLSLGPDQRILASGGQDGMIKLWNLESGKEIYSWSGHARRAVNGVAFSPDGRLLASVGRDKTVRVWSLCTLKQILQCAWPTTPYSVVFSKSGEALFFASSHSVVKWNVTTQEKTRVFGDLLDEPGGTRVEAHPHMVLFPGDRAISSVVSQRRITWSTVSEIEMNKMKGIGDCLSQLSASRDGKRLAGITGERQSAKVCLWESSSGQCCWRKANFDVENGFASLSPTSLRVVVQGRNEKIGLIDLLEGTTSWSQNRHSGEINAIEWFKNGRRVVSGSSDTTITIWMTKRKEAFDKSDEQMMSEAAIKDMWMRLGASDGPTSFDAMVSLIHQPKRAIRMISECLKTTKPVDESTIPRLIEDLDSSEFKVREHATNELAGIRDVAENLLRKELEKSPSEETKRRIGIILAGGRSSEDSNNLLLSSRIVEILETIGTKEAIDLLTAMSKAEGLEETRRDAKDALDRMKLEDSITN